MSLIADQNGIPFNIDIFDGNSHDSKIFKTHINSENLIDISFSDSYFMADSGYDSKEIRNLMKSKKCIVLIPQNKKNIKDKNKINHFTKNNNELFKERIKIEHMFGKLKKFRRIGLRYEKKKEMFLNFIYFALILQMI